jgi:hypothetical protein
MRKGFAILLGGAGLGIGTYVVLRSLSRNRSILNRSIPERSIPDIHLTTADLDFPQVSHEEIVSERLVDLNEAAASELSGLGLDQESVERLVENRPYRSKLELVSRMVIPEPIFATIRDKIAISEGRDPVKVA